MLPRILAALASLFTLSVADSLKEWTLQLEYSVAGLYSNKAPVTFLMLIKVALSW